MDRDLVDDSKSSQLPLGARTGSKVDQVRPDLKNMQSTGSVDQIHPDHLDLEKKISWWKERLMRKILKNQLKGFSICDNHLRNTIWKIQRSQLPYPHLLIKVLYLLKWPLTQEQKLLLLHFCLLALLRANILLRITNHLCGSLLCRNLTNT